MLIGAYIAIMLLQLNKHSFFRSPSGIKRFIRHIHQTNLHKQRVSIIDTRLISIEGNIGAGKSTLLECLRENNSTVKFIDEPVATWSNLKNDDGKNLLETYYSDPNRWSFTFQMCALLSRYDNIENTIKDYSTTHKIFVTERCLQTDHECFTKMLHANKLINKLEYEIYYQYYCHLQSSSTPLSGIIYVNTPPEICYERIRKRLRKGEEAITLQYLKDLHQFTTKWINSLNIPILIVDHQTTKDTIQSFLHHLHVQQ